MSYWATLGLPGYPLSAGVETLAQWVQWALAAIGSGINASSYVPPAWWLRLLDPGGALSTYSGEQIARYNLSQFWAAKQGVLAACKTEAERRQVYRLDMLAHGALNAVASGKMVSAAPEYWDYWQAYLTGGDPPRGSEVYAVEAQQAARDAAAAARASGLEPLGTYFDQAASNTARDLVSADQFWTQSGTLNAGGVPWYLWAAGIVGAALIVRGR